MLDLYIKNIIELHKFRLFPLNSVNNEGLCTCNNEKCASPGKHPKIRANWKKYATSDIKKINEWCEKFDNKINFAILTGCKSNINGKYLIVIDIDDSEHSLITKLKTTFYYKTGSGGYHFWFWSNNEIKNSVSLVDKKIDIRGKNGYVVFPPAKNRQGNYEFFLDSYNEIKNLPYEIECFLVENSNKIKLKDKPIKEKKIKFESSNKLTIKEIKNKINSGCLIEKGMRNYVLHKLLSSDRGKGLEYNDLVKNGNSYINFFEDKNSISESEIKNTVKSVLKYPKYNFVESKITDLFLVWLNKQDGLEFYKNLNYYDLENKFFTENLLYSNYFKTSLKDIIEYRKYWYISQNINIFPTIQSQLFSKKLISIGFEKRKFETKNLWNIDIPKFNLKNECVII